MIRLSLVLFLSLSCFLCGVIGQHAFAVYTLTQGTPNQVTVISGNATGGVQVGSKVSTGGNGVPSGSPRGLESQHPLVVYKNYLFTVNTGSGSVSMFSIDPSDPTKITLINTQSSGGDWPLSLAVWGTWACVANGGTVNGIRCFNFSSSGLSIMSDWDRSFGQNLTLPPVFHTGPAQISFIPDGSGLVVAIKSNDPPLFLWPINNNQLAASATTTPTFGNVPFGFQFDVNDKSTLILTDPAPTAEGVSGVIPVTITAGTSPKITPATSYTLIPNQHAACWIEQSTVNGHFYVANSASNDISEVSRSGNTLTVVKDYGVDASIHPTDMAIAKVGSTDYLFAQSGGTQLLVYSLATAGNAQLLQNVNLQNTTTYGGGVAVYVSSPSMTTTTSSASFLSAGLGCILAFILALLVSSL